MSILKLNAMLEQAAVKALVTSAIVLMFSAAANATSLTYSYVGDPFTGSYDISQSSPPVQPLISNDGTNVTATVTFDATVTSNFTGLVTLSDVTQFSASTGTQFLHLGEVIIGPSHPEGVLASGTFNFVSGVITNWNWGLTLPFHAAIFSENDSGGILDGATANAGQTYFYNVVYGDAGNWSPVGGSCSNVTRLSAAPLPPGWTMLIAGFVGLGFLVYRGSRRGILAAV